MSHHHYQTDPCLRVDKCAMRQIPCACIACTNQLSEKWINGLSPCKQPRYATVEGCKYHFILGEYNKWIITFEYIQNDTDKDYS